MTVAFQQAPDHPVDDLVVSAARPGELDLSSELALEVRRSPNLVASDESTQGLIRKFIRAVINAPTDGIERRLGLVVAGPQQHAEQLGKLADPRCGSDGCARLRQPCPYAEQVRCWPTR